MPTILRSILALLIGLVVGGSVNMGIIMLSPSIIAPPAGVDVTNTESLAASIHLFEPRHFVAPFLAHALGTLVGALVAVLIAASHRIPLGYAVGVCFLLGGISASFMIPAPSWFIALDLLAAYLPMAWIGIRFGTRLRPAAA